MTFTPPQPPLSRREELEMVITELEKQREDAEVNLTSPELDYEVTKRLSDTIKGIDILLGHARHELEELEREKE